jgi:hypothetical protein
MTNVYQRQDYYTRDERKAYNEDYYTTNQKELCAKKREDYYSDLCYHQAAARRRMKRYRKRQRLKRKNELRKTKLLEKQREDT